MRRVVTALALVAVLLGPSYVLAQEETLAWRLEHVAAVQPDTAEAFLTALRRNVGRDERAAVCGMAAYPLKWSGGSVANAAECEARYDALFTMAVRKAVGKQAFEELFVNETGVMVGIGELWFAGRCAQAPCSAATDLRITAVTSETAGLLPPKGKVLLACSVSGQKVRVSADGVGGASLSVWLPGRYTGAPEREFPHAEPPGAPSECAARNWTFSDPARTYIISDLPCDAYLSPPPMGSVGRVTLSTPETPGTPLWCRE